MAQKVFLKEVARLHRIVTDKESKPDAFALKMARIKKFGIVPAPGKETKTYLFYYTIYSFVQNSTATTLLASDVKGKLELYPQTEIHVCYLVNGPSRVPPELEGQKVTKHEVTGFEDLSNYIYSVTGVKPDEATLHVSQKDMIRMIAHVTGRNIVGSIDLDRVRKIRNK